MRAEHGLALARLGRRAEARPLILQALKEQRGFIAAGSDDQVPRLEMAQSLFALALTEPAGGAAELTEAAALLSHLPTEMQAYRSVPEWSARIADARRLRGGPAALSANRN